MKSQGRGRLWSWLVAFPLAGFLLWWSLRGVDWRTVWQTIVAARWSLLALAAVMVCLSFFLRALRWRILLNAEETLSIGAVFRATMAGYMGNAFLPARAGEVVRTLMVSSRSNLSKTYVLTTALCERLSDVVALVLWASLILLAIHPEAGWMTGVARSMAVAAGLGAVAIAVLPHTGSLCEKTLQRLPLPPAVRTRLVELAGQVLLGMRAFHHAGRFLSFAGFTIVVWVTDALGTMLGAHALGLRVSFPVAMLLLTGLGLGSALPSTPGYVGIYQFVAVTVLTPLGIPRSSALAFILVLQAYGYLALLALGLPAMYFPRAEKTLRTADPRR